MICLTYAGVFGVADADWISAAIPATCGDAIEVPAFHEYPWASCVVGPKFRAGSTLSAAGAKPLLSQLAGGG